MKWSKKKGAAEIINRPVRMQLHPSYTSWVQALFVFVAYGEAAEGVLFARPHETRPVLLPLEPQEVHAEGRRRRYRQRRRCCRRWCWCWCWCCSCSSSSLHSLLFLRMRTVVVGTADVSAAPAASAPAAAVDAAARTVSALNTPRPFAPNFAPGEIKPFPQVQARAERQG